MPDRSRFNPALLLALALTACGSDSEFQYIDVGVTVRLNAVADIADQFVAVGADGVIVDDDGQSWDVGDMELRDVALLLDQIKWRWLVVGDQGLVLHASHTFDTGPKPIEWVAVDAETTADLYAAAFWESHRIVVAGDETLRVLRGSIGPNDPEYQFSIEPLVPPPGGWGRLRTLFVGPGPRLWAAGEQGRLLWAEGNLQQWFVEEVDTTSHFRAGGELHGRAWVVGDEGAIWFARPNEPWNPESLQTQHDLLGFGFGVIGSDQTIRSFYLREGQIRQEVLARFDWQPRGIGESHAVGDDGKVVHYFRLNYRAALP